MNGSRMRKSNWDRASSQSGAWILEEGRGGMKKFGLVPEDQKNKEKGNWKSTKLAEKHENVRIVPSHNIHINLSPCHCCFVTLQPFF